MKQISTILFITMTLCLGCSKETPSEKMKVQTDNIKRSLQKAVNRTDEEACGTLTGDSKIECLSKKAKNRAIETKDVIIDKSNELKNKIDD